MGVGVKQAEATAVPFADSAVDTASSAPIPGLAVGTKPAPGQTGPRGVAPRTNYSRVNTGSPLSADAGASAQKSMPPDPQSFLPPKIAEVSAMMTPRITISEMIKAAAAGVASSAAVATEAERQRTGQEPQAKVASSEWEDSIPTSYCEKLAAAAEHVLANLKIAEEHQGPGTGPNALAVTQAVSSNNEIEAGRGGTAHHAVPKDTALQRPSGVPAGPATALEDNASMMHGEQGKVAGVAELAGKLRGAAIQHAGVARGAAKDAIQAAKKHPAATAAALAAAPATAAGGYALGKHLSKKKEASVASELVEVFLGHVKAAEDAINPAQISAGAAVPPDTSAAGESGGTPAGGAPQGSTSLVSSNESAINYTKGTAKQKPKQELAAVLTEPALSAATDKTLNQAFDSTAQAGAKIAGVSDLVSRAAASPLAGKLQRAGAGVVESVKKNPAAAGLAVALPTIAGASLAKMHSDAQKDYEKAKASAKTASAADRTVAARALLDKLAAESCKKKVSQGGETE